MARYYDELMDGVPYRMWAGYYLLLLSHQDIHPETILDVCCGTGRMCELLTEEGFKLSGFDISEPMIREARRKAAKNKLDIRYEVADAASFEMGETYDAAFSFFDSLNYITDPSRLASAIKQVGKHLKPGGSFVFDLNTAYAFEASLFNQKQLTNKRKLRYEWTGDWNPESRLIHVHMKFWKGDEEFEEMHVQRAYSDEEIWAMLKDAGFAEVRAFHSYTLNPPRYKSDRVHYACMKC
ncbi:MAG: class I SAM-dependent methyltransferase [Fimbriimonadaceae bacterium]